MCTQASPTSDHDFLLDYADPDGRDNENRYLCHGCGLAHTGAELDQLAAAEAQRDEDEAEYFAYGRDGAVDQ